MEKLYINQCEKYTAIFEKQTAMYGKMLFYKRDKLYLSDRGYKGQGF
jgi:hypothetical protein